MTTQVLFDALVNWVENGVAPDYLVQQSVPRGRERSACIRTPKSTRVQAAPTIRRISSARPTLTTIRFAGEATANTAGQSAAFGQ